MSPEALGALVAVLLAAGVVSATVAWTRTGARVWTPVTALLLAAAAGVAAAPDAVTLAGSPERALLVTLAGLLALLGGGPVTARVFAAVDTQQGGAPDVDRAGSVLRGGAWIGALERVAVYASLLAGWPEGVAVVLAVKGLGRYPELRNGDSPGTAERFIIGTFTSVLWAAACAGVARLVL